MNIAFYAPMKSPNHPIPSGDRRVANLFIRALEGAGGHVELASEFRCYDKSGDAQNQKEIRENAEREVERLVFRYQNLPASQQPKLWFSYHVYHKAPDWVGSRVSKMLGIPYFIAEASHAPKQANGPWAEGYTACMDMIRQADRVFHMTKLDGACLEQLVTAGTTLFHCPPFVEKLDTPVQNQVGIQQIVDAGGSKTRVTLLCVAMMRDGDKLNSYKQLAEALGLLESENWQLCIVGDGPEQAAVKSLFAGFGDHILYLGKKLEEELADIYAAADLYVWPASGEAYGMAFLEAERVGTPVVSTATRGVPDVVLDNKTGLLSGADDMMAFAKNITTLINDKNKRTELGLQAELFVAQSRSIEATSAFLQTHIEKVLS